MHSSHVFVLLFSTAAAARQLELVSLAFRHGDRSPTYTFPTNPYEESAWPQGYKQLTQKGMLQLYHLGQKIMNRYMKNRTETYLLNSTYQSKEIYVRSTDIDRTLVSAESQMAALYKPSGDQIFLPGLEWQPTPIHTVPVTQDDLLRAYAVDCPRYAELREQGTHDADYIAVMEKYKNLFARLKNRTGVDYDITVSNAYKILDSFYCEKQHNMTWPDWFTDREFADLLAVNNFSLYKMFSGEETHKLTAGIFLGEVLGHMEMKRNGTEMIASKIFMYSAHDLTLVAILSALGLFGNDSVQPPYASAVMIELYLEENGSNTVEVYYHMGPDAANPTQRMILPGCSPPCTLDKFREFASPLLVNDFQKECQLPIQPDSHNYWIVGVAVGAVIVCLAGIVALIVLATRYRSRRRQRRRRRDGFNPIDGVV